MPRRRHSFHCSRAFEMENRSVIYQISRWLTDYVESFRNIDRLRRQFGLDEILAPRTNVDFSGGGPDAPSLRRTLGIGACFVVRELMRFRVLADV